MKTCCGQTYDLRGYTAHLAEAHANQCDGCKVGAPTHEHDGITYHCMAPGDLMICQASKYEPEPTTKLTPEDFASLLEREPQEESAKAADAEGWKRLYWDAIKTCQSASDRIKSLEDVLVAIRAKAASARGTSGAPLVACREIMELVTETLDPCEPWCAMEPGHPGACLSGEEMDRGE